MKHEEVACPQHDTSGGHAETGDNTHTSGHVGGRHGWLKSPTSRRLDWCASSLFQARREFPPRTLLIDHGVMEAFCLIARPVTISPSSVIVTMVIDCGRAPFDAVVRDVGARGVCIAA